MTPSIFARHALKTRATLLTLLIFVVGLWSLTLYTSHMLREDLHKLLAEHQDNMVAILSSQLSEEMGDRAAALAQFAQSGALGATQSGSVLQSRLQANGLFQEHFNGGTFVTNAQGVSIADSRLTGAQASAGRVGIPYSDRDYVRDALDGRALAIGRPVLGRVLHAPVVGMAVPLRTSDGAVSGVLAGVIDLSRSAFLDHTVRPKFSRSGSFCIVDRRYRMVVLCSDKSISLQPLEAVGVSEQMERYLAGEEGSAVVVSADGEEALAAVRSVPRTPWLVLGLLPTSQAYAPVYALQNRMVVAALIVSLIACALTWWMLRQQLSPLLDAATRLSQISVARTVPEPLPVEREDEVGALVGAFNRVLGQLSDHARAQGERGALSPGF